MGNLQSNLVVTDAARVLHVSASTNDAITSVAFTSNIAIATTTRATTDRTTAGHGRLLDKTLGDDGYTHLDGGFDHAPRQVFRFGRRGDQVRRLVVVWAGGVVVVVW